MSLPWFRMYARFVTDPVIEELSFDDQRHYVFLLCLKCDGLLDKTFPNPEMRERAISRRLGLRDDALAFAKQRLIDSQLIDEQWHPTKWDDLQFKSDSSADRQRKYRERHRNVTVTAQEQIREEEEKKRSEGQKAVSRAEELRASLPDLSRLSPEQRRRQAASKT
jgi:hypothetical protein